MKWCWLALVTTLLGCTIPVRPPPTFTTADAALAAAEQDVEAGHWQTAIDKLQVAEQQFSDAPAISARRAELVARWDHLRAEWEDRLALVRAQGRRDELTLLQRLDTATTGNLFDTLQLEQKKSLLLVQRGNLLGCAQRQLDSDLELAQACADLAHGLEADDDSRELRKQIAAQQRAEIVAIQARQAAAQAKVAAKQEQARQTAIARRDLKLKRAQDLANEQKDVRASTLVQQVLEDEPDNQRAQTLHAALREKLAKQSRVLSDLADRLYGESNVEAAIRIWEASLSLVPDQPEVLERYKRAKRVRGNLEQLREAPETSSGVPRVTRP